MKKIALLFSTTTALVILLGSCKNDSKFEGYTLAENGLYYKYFNHTEDGVKPKQGDQIFVHYIFMNQKNDSVIMDSKNNSRDGSGYVEMGVPPPTFKGSLEDGLTMMAKGDSVSFIVPADSFFLKTMRVNELPKPFKKGDYIKATMKLKDIQSKAEFEEAQKKKMAENQIKVLKAQETEKADLDKYLADNKVTAKPTQSGLYYIETKKGNGSSPTATDMVKVHYTGKLLNGTKFDSSVDRGQPIEFPLNQVIKGWTEGLQLMKKGGKATLIIPSILGYGAQEQGSIPAFSPLVFDVELIDFKSAPEQQAPPAPPHH